ncbi:low affinity iron permease family protein [Allokutzneria albata]|nr:low affinity iron permease family protein [Allokutzneria albata]
MADAVATAAGSPWMSGLSIIVVIALLLAGVLSGFPAHWQTIVYSLGALVSLLLLFSIQHSTNRQTEAILLKLDELIKATRDASDDVIAVEERDLHEQERLHSRQHDRHQRH